MDSEYPIVEVLWRDAIEIGEIGWNDPDEIKEEAMSPCPLVKSIGYLIYESESHISLLRAIHSEGVSTLEKIPKGFIEAIKKLQRV